MSRESSQLQPGRVGAGALVTFIVLALSLLVGLRYGGQWGSAWGIPGMLGGALLGIIAAIVFTLASLFLAGAISIGVYWVAGRWKPVPARCANGVCTRKEHFQDEDLPPTLRSSGAPVSMSGYRCSCGDLYAVLNARRWVRVTREGALEPYLVHRLIRRWRRDDSAFLPIARTLSDAAVLRVMGAIFLVGGAAALLAGHFLEAKLLVAVGGCGVVGGVAIEVLALVELRTECRRRSGAVPSRAGESVRPSSDKLPGWVLPITLALLTGGVTLSAVWSEGALGHRGGWWFIAGATMLGALMGLIFPFGSAWRRRRIAATGRDPLNFASFFGLKLLGIFMGAGAVGRWFMDLDETTLEGVVGTFIFGGLSLAMFFGEAFFAGADLAPRRVRVNRYTWTLAKIGIGLFVLGALVGLVAIH